MTAHRNPGDLPTFAELENAGHDAGALLDSIEQTFEFAAAMAQDKTTRTALAEDMKRVQRLRAEYFGGKA